MSTRCGLAVVAITLLFHATAPARAAEDKPREFVLYYADRPVFEVGEYRLMPHGWAAGVAFKQSGHLDPGRPGAGAGPLDSPPGGAALNRALAPGLSEAEARQDGAR